MKQILQQIQKENRSYDSLRNMIWKRSNIQVHYREKTGNLENKDQQKSRFKKKMRKHETL